MAYYGADNGFINDQITYEGTYNFPSTLPFGTDLSSKIDLVIDAAISNASWPQDPNAIYALFLAGDIQESTMRTPNPNPDSLSSSSSSSSTTTTAKTTGLCKSYCGYHSITYTTGLKYNVIGDGSTCPGTLPPPGQPKGTTGCLQRAYRNHTETPTYSINRDQTADSMITVLAHEITETASNYDNAWRDPEGEENADKCSAFYLDYRFDDLEGRKDDGGDGGSGAYNVDFTESGGGKYLIQSNWSIKQQKCVLKED
jgi:hypothetical protein